MILICLGIALIALKYLEIGMFAELSWWWTLSPFVAALIWFEFLEKIFGFDRRNVEHKEWEKRRKERVAEQFAVDPRTGRPAKPRR